MWGWRLHAVATKLWWLVAICNFNISCPSSWVYIPVWNNKMKGLGSTVARPYGRLPPLARLLNYLLVRVPSASVLCTWQEKLCLSTVEKIPWLMGLVMDWWIVNDVWDMSYRQNVVSKMLGRLKLADENHHWKSRPAYQNTGLKDNNTSLDLFCCGYRPILPTSWRKKSTVRTNNFTTVKQTI